MSVRRLLVLLASWSAVVVVILLFWPSAAQTPGCMSKIDPLTGCVDLLAAMNDRVRWYQTVPLLVVMGSGYVLILGLALRSWRRRRDAGANAD